MRRGQAYYALAALATQPTLFCSAPCRNTPLTSQTNPFPNLTLLQPSPKLHGTPGLGSARRVPVMGRTHAAGARGSAAKVRTDELCFCKSLVRAWATILGIL